MSDVILQLLVLFVIIGVGFAAGRLGYTSAESDRRTSSLVLYFACPALVLHSCMGGSLPDAELIPPLLAVGFLTYLVLLPVASFLPRLLHLCSGKRGIFGFMMVFGNVGFIGYPVVASIFGPDCVFYASVLNFPNTFFVFVLGSSLISGSGCSRFNWRLFVGTPMLASYLSIILVLCQVHNYPFIVTEPLRLLGDLTVPLALFLIGSSMAKLPLSLLRGSRGIYASISVRLFFVPILLFAIFSACGFPQKVVLINSVLLATPVAAYGTILCLKYQKDVDTMAVGTFLSNALCVFSLPLVVCLLRLWSL